ncbi:hypothetical protein BD779DRAFT_1471118 [Infundibulicybe gibba]|nr:hypothetical protein BD779DRAFT_1471118 [Infundibulicybe gibba]
MVHNHYPTIGLLTCVFPEFWAWDPDFNFPPGTMQGLLNSLTSVTPNPHVIRGSPKTILPILCKEWCVTRVVSEKDAARYDLIRDRHINDLASQASTQAQGLMVLGHTLHDPETVVKSNGRKATVSLASRRGVCSADYTIPGPNYDFSIPTPEELCLPNATTSVRRGESEVLCRLNEYCADLACAGRRLRSERWSRAVVSGNPKPNARKEVILDMSAAIIFAVLRLKRLMQIYRLASAVFSFNRYHEDRTKTLPRPSGNPAAEARFMAWCFLTRGQCYISWERGAEVLTNVCWIGTPVPIREIGCHILKVVRKYCPELARYPDKSAHCLNKLPWIVPSEVRKTAGCIIGKDYPIPTLGETLEKERYMIRMKTYSLRFHGADREVLDGTAGIAIEENIKKRYC